MRFNAGIGTNDFQVTCKVCASFTPHRGTTTSESNVRTNPNEISEARLRKFTNPRIIFHFQQSLVKAKNLFKLGCNTHYYTKKYQRII